MLRLNTNFACEKSDENEMLIYNPENESTFVLNSTATLLYECCSHGKKREVLKTYYDKLSEMFIDLGEEHQIMGDAEIMLDGFLQQGIVIEVVAVDGEGISK